MLKRAQLTELNYALSLKDANSDGAQLEVSDVDGNVIRSASLDRVTMPQLKAFFQADDTPKLSVSKPRGPDLFADQPASPKAAPKAKGPDLFADEAAGGKQTVMPGAERITAKEEAQRAMDARKLAKKPQKDVDELPLFGDKGKQLPLLSIAWDPQTQKPKSQPFTERGLFRSIAAALWGPSLRPASKALQITIDAPTPRAEIDALMESTARLNGLDANIADVRAQMADINATIQSVRNMLAGDGQNPKELTAYEWLKKYAETGVRKQAGNEVTLKPTTPDNAYAGYDLYVAGERVGHIYATLSGDKKTIKVNYLSVDGGPNSMGPSFVRSLHRQLKKIHPGAKKITALRVTGARGRNAKARLDASVRLSIGEMKDQIKSPEFKRWFGKSKVVDKDGKPLVVYHGTQRPDRIGDVFRKDRATAGPMAFFTDDPELASSYALGKQDTSLSDGDREYGSWFKAKVPGTKELVPFDKTWRQMTRDQQEKMKALAGRVTLDDEGMAVELGPEGLKTGNGGYVNALTGSRGDVVAALKDAWLTSGALFDDEGQFAKVLRLAGYPFKVEEDFPNASYPAVMPVFLKISNPLVTDAIPDRVMTALKAALKKPGIAAQVRNQIRGWHKNDQNPDDWLREVGWIGPSKGQVTLGR
jgi:hypothetical protein